MRNLKRKPMPVLSDSLIERFWSNVDVRSEADCWNWKRPGKEYPRFYIGEEDYRASRLAIFIDTGIDGYEAARHTCDNPRCCNPRHLVPGTLDDNMKDKVERKRSSRLPGVTNGRAKLTEGDVRYIRDTFSSTNCTKKWLAERFDVSTAAIRMILDRVTWKHIP